MYRILIFISVFSIVILSCKKDETPQAEIDEKIIKEYIESHNLDATRDESGIYYIISREGSGGSPNYYSSIKVNYSGYLTNDTVFDSGSLNYYPLSQLISGWQIGIPMLSRGGQGKFIIPSRYGYGKYEQDDIPANSVIVFDVTLIDFK